MAAFFYPILGQDVCQRTQHACAETGQRVERVQRLCPTIAGSTASITSTLTAATASTDSPTAISTEADLSTADRDNITATATVSPFSDPNPSHGNDQDYYANDIGCCAFETRAVAGVPAWHL